MNYEELTPLEALKQLKNYKELTYVANITGYEKVNRKLAYNDELKQLFCIIEQALKQAQEDKEMLSVFKNALTIKRDDANVVHNECGGMIEMIYTIEKNKLNEQLRKSLREWVLENAFPKELKELEERREMMRRFNEACVPMILDNETEKKLRALEIIEKKEVDVALLKLSENVERYNAQIKLTHLTIPYFELTPKEYDLLKEVLS